MTGLLRMRKAAYVLLLVGVLMMLTTVAVTAAKEKNGPPTPFAAAGVLQGIDDGNVTAAGKSGRFVVKDRTITGMLSGDLAGSFSFTFGTNVPLLTQSGQIHGTLTVGGYEAKVQASSEVGMTPWGVQGLLIDGTLTFTDGTQGHGEVHGFVFALVDAEGHIIGFYGGGIGISGQWHQ